MNRAKRSKHRKTSKKPKSSFQAQKAKGSKAHVLTPANELDLFHCMVNHIGDEVIVADQDARIVFVNKAAVQGLGHSKKEILSRRFTDYLEHRIPVKEWRRIYFAPVRKKRKPVSFTVNRVIKGGKIRTLHMTVVYMLFRSKHYVVAVGRDITEQTAFEGKLKESEDRYRLLSEQAADGILVVDASGHVIYANEAAGRLHKTTPAKLLGVHFEALVDKPSIPVSWEYFKKAKNGDAIVHQQVDIRDQEGNRVPVEFTASPIFKNQKVDQIHVIFRDISERREMEALIRESEKMDAFRDFIVGTTLEIQQPLKGLLVHSQSLIDRYKNRDFEYIGYKEFRDILKTLKTMNAQVRYCFETAERLNKLNRHKAKMERDYCSPNHIIREVVKMLKHPLEVSDIHLKLSLSPQMPHAAINALDLSQVLNNVITNAIQSLPGGGGRVEIKTVFQRSSRTVRIECKDDGVGIPQEVLSRIFDPFFTTKSRGLEQNSGLGLYIVHSIVKSHQGDVLVKSHHREGTLVTILLPAHQRNPKGKKR